MRYASFIAQNRPTYGIAVAGGVFDLGARLGTAWPDLKSYLAGASVGAAPAVPGSNAADHGPGEFTLLPVIPNPDKVICVGLNYEEHRKETGRPESAHPSIFTRFADTLLAHGAPIVLPTVSSMLDWEGELAVVIGTAGFRVAEADAMGLVAGHACFNDATLRDWQRHTSQFIPGKNFPATGPFGPELVTPDEAGALPDQPIETRLNGQVVQSAKLGDMIFSIPRVIAYVSGFTRLRPGDGNARRRRLQARAATVHEARRHGGSLGGRHRPADQPGRRGRLSGVRPGPLRPHPAAVWRGARCLDGARHRHRPRHAPEPIHRIVREMTGSGFLEAANDSQHRLGPCFIEFDRLIHVTDPLHGAGMPLLREIVMQVRAPCVAVLARLYNDTVMCVADAASPDARVRTSYERGRPRPLTRGATSKAILAQLPSRRLLRLLAQEGGGTPGDGGPEALQNELASTRKRGFSITRGEWTAG